MPTEADARIIVDRLLRESGWDIEDKGQVSTEEGASDGRADYVLKDQRSRPLAIVEAKKFSTDPYSAKEQALAYARTLGASFIIRSKLAELRIPFPKDKAEQRRIVGRLDALAAKQTELRRLQTETEAELAAFTPALLAKAFRGKL